MIRGRITCGERPSRYFVGLEPLRGLTRGERFDDFKGGNGSKYKVIGHSITYCYHQTSQKFKVFFLSMFRSSARHN